MGIKRSRDEKKTALRLCVVLTSRGNYAKFKVLMRLAEQDPDIDLKVAVGGELVLKDRVVKEFDLPEHTKIYFNIAGDNTQVMSKSTGNAIHEFANYFSSIEPDVVAVVGDRFETLGVVIAAYMNNIPVAHLEGGELTGSMDEGTRHAITKMSSVHFPCNNDAVDIIKKLGEDPKLIHNVGSTSIDALSDGMVNKSEFMKFQESHGIGSDLNIDNPFLVVIQHPVTNEIESISEQIGETMWAIKDLNMPTFWIGSNLDAGSGEIGSFLRKYREKYRPDNIKFFKSLPIEYYGFLLKNAACVVGNSSSGIRECGFFGTPNVSIGTRQNNRLSDINTIRVSYDHYYIQNAVEDRLIKGKYPCYTTYGCGVASQQIIEILKNINLTTQKVFYEYDMGNCSCEGGKCRDKE